MRNSKRSSALATPRCIPGSPLSQESLRYTAAAPARQADCGSAVGAALGGTLWRCSLTNEARSERAVPAQQLGTITVASLSQKVGARHGCLGAQSASSGTSSSPQCPNIEVGRAAGSCTSSASCVGPSPRSVRGTAARCGPLRRAHARGGGQGPGRCEGSTPPAAPAGQYVEHAVEQRAVLRSRRRGSRKLSASVSASPRSRYSTRETMRKAAGCRAHVQARQLAQRAQAGRRLVGEASALGGTAHRAAHAHGAARQSTLRARR